MSETRSVTISLKKGYAHAVLPSGRPMEYGKTYEVSYDEFRQIANDAKAGVIQVASTYTIPRAVCGADITTDTSALPTYTLTDGEGDTVTGTWKLGTVLDGFDRDALMLVQVVDASVAAGDALCWASIDDLTVTKDREGGTAADPLVFAGVATGTITKDQYGWIQIDGEASVKVADGVGIADQVALAPTVDGVLREVTGTDVAMGTSLAANTSGQPAARQVLLKGDSRRHKKMTLAFLEDV